MRPVSGNLGNAINFDDIEPEKENIVPLREGRSARELTQALASDSSELHMVKVSFEKRLLDELEDMDDPLELFLEYISWINNAYPQGGTSKKSGMLDVIERCITYFKDMETYKNDPRYLKIWLWYIELFSSDIFQESKDIYVYMFRKRIGAKLALFYEEFATLLFHMGKFQEAHTILKLGIEENSRPQNRLRKKLRELEVKLRGMNFNFDCDPRSHTHFLASEQNLFVLGRRRTSIASTEGVANTPSQEVRQTSKYEIFQDGTGIPGMDRHDIQRDGWDTLESKSARTKENKTYATLLESGSNVGKLQQTSEVVSSNLPSTSQKLSIFKDNLGRSDPVYKILHVPGKKPEKIDCNFNLIYPKGAEEFCIEEILAKSRNLYYKQKHAIPEENESNKDDLQGRKRRKKLAPLVIKTPLGKKVAPKETSPTKENPPSPGIFPSQQENLTPSRLTEGPDSQEYKQRHLEYKGITKTSILPLRDPSENDRAPDLKSKDSLQPPKSPTMTFFSKAAMNEVYSMYNQHYDEPKVLLDNEENTNKFMFDNFTQEFTRQHMDDLTEVKPREHVDEKELEKTPNKPHAKVEIDLNLTNEKDPNSNDGQKDFMTPILEHTEKTEPFFDREREGNGIYAKDHSGSPFLAQTQQDPRKMGNIRVIENPLDPQLREQLLAGISPPLDQYDTFYRYNQPLKMSSLLKRIHKLSKTENKNPIVDFKKTGDLYCIRNELGEGGYATVYLAESSTGNLRALKVEKPASVWEYYILKQAEHRLGGHTVLSSIINAYSLHCFQDESYLVLNYASQGTILDLINLQKEKSGGPLDESLCMFFTVELLKIVESIHDAEILHGDLKSDNCMIRFETGSLGPYHPDGSQGWRSKGIYLIDFGRSFDMKLLQPNTKFRANWKTDQQDCFEMRSGQPWTYEADYYGLAGIIHAMLFGNLIESVRLSNGRFKLRQSFKRYWQQNIWSSVFDVLLNSGDFCPFPMKEEIAKLRLSIEDHLSSQAGVRLRDIVIDLEPELARFRR